MIKIKIIFLDIDGVLNTERYLRIQSRKCKGIIDSEMQFNFDPEATKNLCEIVDKTDSYIVVCSKWKNDKNSRLWVEFMNNMHSIKLGERILDSTSNSYNNLISKEIEEWFNNNVEKEIDNFVIISDKWNMGKYTDNNYVRCWEYSGITDDVKSKVIDILCK